uniref:Putative short-chain dehydrogenases/reductases (SDR) family protein n=2 Tax=termite gut metagenome TaxID=433724 RepID=S0DDN0_9ZZZZ
MNELFGVAGKVVVITGATGVLGSVMVRHFVAEGAEVVILGRNMEKAQALADEVNARSGRPEQGGVAHGGEALAVRCDVVDRQSVEESCRITMERYGRVDVLINGAGGNQPGATVPPDKTIFDLDIEAMRGVVDLNLFGTVIPTMVYARAMVGRADSGSGAGQERLGQAAGAGKKGQGSIINIASESALRPLTRVAGYGAAKAAVVNFTKYLCGELALKFGEGLRVNAIAPGFFLTEQNRALLTNPDGSLTPRAEAIIAHTPFGRFGEPEELLGTLQWLASDASRFVSGTLTVVDGGFDAFSI